MSEEDNLRAANIFLVNSIAAKDAEIQDGRDALYVLNGIVAKQRDEERKLQSEIAALREAGKTILSTSATPLAIQNACYVLANPAPIADAMLRVIAEATELVVGLSADSRIRDHSRIYHFNELGQALADLRAAQAAGEPSAQGGA